LEYPHFFMLGFEYSSSSIVFILSLSLEISITYVFSLHSMSQEEVDKAFHSFSH
jgi:hypothetical protein